MSDLNTQALDFYETSELLRDLAYEPARRKAEDAFRNGDLNDLLYDLIADDCIDAMHIALEHVKGLPPKPCSYRDFDATCEAVIEAEAQRIMEEQT